MDIHERLRLTQEITKLMPGASVELAARADAVIDDVEAVCLALERDGYAEQDQGLWRLTERAQRAGYGQRSYTTRILDWCDYDEHGRCYSRSGQRLYTGDLPPGHYPELVQGSRASG